MAGSVCSIPHLTIVWYCIRQHLMVFFPHMARGRLVQLWRANFSWAMLVSFQQELFCVSFITSVKNVADHCLDIGDVWPCLGDTCQNLENLLESRGRGQGHWGPLRCTDYPQMKVVWLRALTVLILITVSVASGECKNGNKTARCKIVLKCSLTGRLSY